MQKIMIQPAPQMSNFGESDDVNQFEIQQELARIREQSGLTQTELAERAGLALRTIQKIEGGEQVKKATLEAVADALGYEIGLFFSLKKKY